MSAHPPTPRSPTALDQSPDDVAAAREGLLVSLDDRQQGASFAGADDTPIRPHRRRRAARRRSRPDSAGALSLSPRERIVLYLRFYVGMSQNEVAQKLGISQMQVSRLQHRSLEKVRRSSEPQT